MEDNLTNIVPTNVPYTYKLLMENIRDLKNKYSFLQVGSIGNSVLGKNIPYIKIGNGSKETMYFASIHANEWITSVLLMKFIENFCIQYVAGGSIYGYNARELFSQVSLYIVPMLNPDTVDLVTGFLKPGDPIYENYRFISNNFPQIPFPSGWKANFNGVDLNLQFPAGWENARRIKFEQGFNKPSPRDFVGYGPLTVPESLAIYNFSLAHNFNLNIAYHTQGRVIFWKYLDYLPPYSYEIGNYFAQSSGYSLETTPYASSFAGYKDWFISAYNRPGYTIEAVLGENPLPISQFDTIYKENEGILVLGMIF